MAGDTYWSSVALLLPFDGPDGFASTADKSSFSNAVAVNGAATISTEQSKFGSSSMKFSLGGSLTAASSAAFGFGAGDLTVEAWVYLTSNAVSSANNIVDFRASAGATPWTFFVVNTGPGNYLGTYLSTTPDCTSGTNYLSLNTWYHVALSRASGTWRLFVNGAQVGTASNSNNLGSSNQLTVGNVVGGTGTTANFPGYIDDLRITKGVARYTANFTPPSSAFVAGMGQVIGTVRDDTDALCSRLVRAYRRDTGALVGQAYTQAGDSNIGNVALLLHMDGTNGSTTITDNSATPKTVTAVGNAQISTTQSKFGGSSLYLDGTGDYLSVAHNSALSLILGDWTIEAWIYPVALPASGAMEFVNKDGVSGTSYSQYAIGVTSTGKLTAFLGNGNGVSPTGTSYTGTTTVTTGAWHHVAVVKNGSTCLGFLDGNLEWSSASATMYEGSKALLIGYETGQPGTVYFNGHIDDLRITKGVARYTANFTPPSERFPDNNLALGNYVLNFPTLDEVNVIAYDDTAGSLYNDQILRVIPA